MYTIGPAPCSRQVKRLLSVGWQFCHRVHNEHWIIIMRRVFTLLPLLAVLMLCGLRADCFGKTTTPDPQKNKTSEKSSKAVKADVKSAKPVKNDVKASKSAKASSGKASSDKGTSGSRGSRSAKAERDTVKLGKGKGKGKSKGESKKKKKHPAVVQSNDQAVRAADEALRKTPEGGSPKAVAAAEPNAPVREQPKSEAEADYEKGMELGRQNQYKQSLDHFNQAIKSDGANPNYYAGRGHANFMLGNLDKALDDYNKAVSFNTTDPLAFVMRGHTNLKLRNFAKSIQDYDKAVQMGYEDTEVYKGRGSAYAQMNQPEKMCSDYKAACQKGDCELFENAKHGGFCTAN